METLQDQLNAVHGTSTMYQVVTSNPYKVIATAETWRNAISPALVWQNAPVRVYLPHNGRITFGHDKYARIEPENGRVRLNVFTEDANERRDYLHHSEHGSVQDAITALVLDAGVLASESLMLTITADVPRILTTYEVVTEDSAKQGDFERCGWKDEEGHECTPDVNADEDEPETVVSNAVQFLRDHYVCHASSYPFSVGTWYESEPEQDYQERSDTTHAYHLHGFTPEQEEEIYNQLIKRS
jgi:hypothetical protein